MGEHILVGLAGIIVLGIASQWLAWRLRLPSILLLLLAGFIAGSVTGLLDPDVLLGDLLSPIVAIAVALILFEGGLSLKMVELRQVGGVVRNLVTIGALITWLLAAGAAHFVLGLDAVLSLLLGAILVVTGPTVIMPLLRDIRPVGQVGTVVRWEGILIDPIGVTLAVLVFEAVFIGDLQRATVLTVIGFVETLVIGIVVGLITAALLTLFLRRYWIPDFLQTPVTVLMVVGAFALSEVLQPESGLLTATVMGIALANQRSVSVKHIVEFKENLGVMLISNLFIVLAARLRIEDIFRIGPEMILFVVVLVLVVRPLAVFVSTMRSPLNWRERLFVAWLAPRGIVAAATASIFGLELMHMGHPQAELLAPMTFTVIVVTVALYGLTAGPLARRLGITQSDPQGVLFVGAHGWARAMASVLQKRGYRVLLVDTNYDNVVAARMEGLPAHYGSILSEDTLAKLDLDGIGRLLALTPNEEVNSLAALRFSEIFERSEVYQLFCRQQLGEEAIPRELRGRLLFGPGITFENLEARFSNGAVIRATPLTDKFTYEDFQALYNEAVLPLFLIDENGKLAVFAADKQPLPRRSQTVISLVENGAPALATQEVQVSADPA